MKNLMMIALLSFALNAQAEQTPAEKVKNTAKQVGAEMSKAANRVEETVCETVNGKVKCLAKKAKHRVQETKTDVQNKAEELKDEVD